MTQKPNASAGIRASDLSPTVRESIAHLLKGSPREKPKDPPKPRRTPGTLSRKERYDALLARLPEGHPRPVHYEARLSGRHSPAIMQAKNRLYVRNYQRRARGLPPLDAYISSEGQVILISTGQELSRYDVVKD
jgi:hypothetical protein